MNDDTSENNDDNFRVNNNKEKTSKSFEFKTKIMGNTSADNKKLHREVVVPFVSLQRFFGLLLIDCGTLLDLRRSTFCILSEWSKTDALTATATQATRTVTETSGPRFQINSTKICVFVVTLSLNYNIKVLENMKQGFKRTIAWNKLT